MAKTLGEEVAEQLRAALQARAKPKPEVKVVAQTAVEPESVRVGAARSVGEVLEKLDPDAKGARFVTARRVPSTGTMAEEAYWREVDRLMNAPGPGVTVRFEYHPLQAFDDSIPEFNRSK